MPKFTVTGTLTIDVTASIEAESEQDAKDQLDMADCCAESTDESITFNDCCQADCEIDEVTWDAEKKWNDLSKSERMEMLKGNGASDDAAYYIAGRSFKDVPNEWQEYFE